MFFGIERTVPPLSASWLVQAALFWTTFSNNIKQVISLLAFPTRDLCPRCSRLRPSHTFNDRICNILMSYARLPPCSGPSLRVVESIAMLVGGSQ